MTTNRETTPPTPNAGEWITHDGGPNPVPGQLVNMRFRDGEVIEGQISGLFDWLHSPKANAEDDIIAYRLATPSPAAQDAAPSINPPMESEAAPDVTKRAAALSRLAELDGETMDLPAAQDDPAKGLEVEFWARRRPTWDFWTMHHGEPIERDGWELRPLTDHATAERQIAELRSRVAEYHAALIETDLDLARQKVARHEAEARASILEAENKGLRELARHLIDWITDEVGAELPFSEADAKLIETAATLAKDTPQ